MKYFITGIGTNVGKTVASAVLVEAMKADYWKPIQSGTIESRDLETVKSLVSNKQSVFHPEVYSLKEPLSPHFAAKLENIEIDINHINLPKTNNHLLIEGAGGLLVPINSKHYVIDIAKKFDCEVILVISNYLGCINHSLLSIEYLVKNNYKLHALVLNGNFEDEVKQVIINYCKGVKVIEIPNLAELSKENITEIATKISL